MKIEINCPEPRLQASWQVLKNNQGAKISIYFFDGGRYEHDARLISMGLTFIEKEKQQTIVFGVSNGEDEKGTIAFTSETGEEFSIIDTASIWHSRNKESDYFLVLPHDFEVGQNGTFIYQKTF